MAEAIMEAPIGGFPQARSKLEVTVRRGGRGVSEISGQMLQLRLRIVTSDIPLVQRCYREGMAQVVNPRGRPRASRTPTLKQVRCQFSVKAALE